MSGDICDCHDQGCSWHAVGGGIWSRPHFPQHVSWRWLHWEPLVLLWSCIVFQPVPTPAMPNRPHTDGHLAVGVSVAELTLPCICSTYHVSETVTEKPKSKF